MVVETQMLRGHNDDVGIWNRTIRTLHSQKRAENNPEIDVTRPSRELNPSTSTQDQSRSMLRARIPVIRMLRARQYRATIVLTLFITGIALFTNTNDHLLQTLAPEKEEHPLHVLPTDSIMDKWGFDSSPIVVHEFKLLFFTIPKVGCSTWKLLFRRIRGKEDWNTKMTISAHNPLLNGLVYLSRYNTTYAAQLMSDPTWTRAIFVRDPKERLLSAYLDKSLRNDGNYLRKRCCSNKRGKLETCVKQAQSNLSSFFAIARACNDPHWRPQSNRMEAKYWKYMNFVGHMETLAEDGERLLRQIGAWAEYGSNGWGAHSNASMFASASQTNPHITGAASRLRTHYFPALEREVEHYYHEDYESKVFDFHIAN